jgi:hypothetical protein
MGARRVPANSSTDADCCDWADGAFEEGGEGEEEIEEGKGVVEDDNWTLNGGRELSGIAAPWTNRIDL